MVSQIMQAAALAVRSWLIISTLATCAAANAQTAVDDRLLIDVDGGRWGISVRAVDGSAELTANGNQRFMPASTLKLVTTAAALHFLGDFENGGWPRGTALLIKHGPDAPLPSLILRGSGDATLSDDEACEASCLSQFVDAVQAQGIARVQDIIIDDSLFQKSYWPSGWAQDDLRFAFGAAVSALTVDDATAHATIAPGTQIDTPPILTWLDLPAFNVDVSQAHTVLHGFDLDFLKRPGSRWAEIKGTIGLHTGRVPLRFGLDDPSIYAGELFRKRLAESGVLVEGKILRSEEAPVRTDSNLPPRLLFQHPAPDPMKTMGEILHESNNLHSEVLLHHVSLTLRDRTSESGLRLLEHLLIESGADQHDFNIADGSGLSSYNRITPDAMTGLLVWATRQPWYESWSGLLAANGKDGTLEYRLPRGVQEGAVRAKSGTMFGVDGLAGYFRSESGRDYAFTIFLNDSAMSHAEARERIDALIRSLIETL